jgi:hypothetical protein
VEKKRVQYTGALAQVSHDFPPAPLLAGTALLLDAAASAEADRTYRDKKRTWALGQVLHALEGLDLLFSHYKIEPKLENHVLLILALARDHVPYFMPPRKPRGRPRTTSTVVPVVSKVAERAASLGLTQARIFEIAARGCEVDVESIVREVKRHRARVGKKKSNSPT